MLDLHCYRFAIREATMARRSYRFPDVLLNQKGMDLT